MLHACLQSFIAATKLFRGDIAIFLVDWEITVIKWIFLFPLLDIWDTGPILHPYIALKMSYRKRSCLFWNYKHTKKNQGKTKKVDRDSIFNMLNMNLHNEFIILNQLFTNKKKTPYTTAHMWINSEEIIAVA